MTAKNIKFPVFKKNTKARINNFLRETLNKKFHFIIISKPLMG